MSETAIALREPMGVVPSNSQIINIQQLGAILAQSGYFADARDKAQAAVKVLAGAELGIPPIAAMMGIHIIKGKATLGAHLIASRVRAHGYDFQVKRLDNTGCVLVFLGKVDPEGKRHKLGESSFTEEDAKAAGLMSNDTWRKFPRNMYYSRAMSNGSKWFTPEISAGMPLYTPEEMGATVDEEGEVVQPAAPVERIADRRIAEEKAKLDAQRTESQALNIKKVVEQFGVLKAKLGSFTDLYYDLLAKYGKKHSNEFRDRKEAAAAYGELVSIVKEYEALKERERKEALEVGEHDIPAEFMEPSDAN